MEALEALLLRQRSSVHTAWQGSLVAVAVGPATPVTGVAGSFWLFSLFRLLVPEDLLQVDSFAPGPSSTASPSKSPT